MIHLDRSHHHDLDLDQSQKQNLILSRDHDVPHFDWPDPPPFFHDSLSHLAPSPVRPPHDIRDDKSSSLSPAPDSGSPAPPTTSLSSSATQPPSSLSKQEQDLAVDGALTPLTELSPAADQEDLPEDSKDTPDDPTTSSLSSAHQDVPRRFQPTVRVNGTTSPTTSTTSSPSRQLSATDTLSRINGPPLSSHSRASSGDFLVPPLPAGMSTGQPSSDPKVTRILDLNAELFKVCSEFQHHGIPISDARFQQYAMRLQVNLTWLAAAADQRHNNPNVTLPIMEPPIAVEFVSMDRLQHLYSDISTIFAKDVARRRLISSHHRSPSAPAVAPNGALKRTRPDDLPDLASKRRDMGDHKPQVPQPSLPVISLSTAPPHSNPPSAFHPPAQPTAIPTPQLIPQSPRVASPAMPPPAPTPSLPFGATEASIAATTRTRARDLQIQQAREQQMRQAAQAQQMRHMSPPSTSQQVPQPVPNAQSNPFGPQASQSALQNYNNLMQHMITQIPQFNSLPPQQQMQKIHMFQNAIAQRQQQQQHQLQNSHMASSQRNPQMAGMTPNVSMSPMSNGILGPGGGQSPVSPLSQQSPLAPLQAPQQHLSHQPVQNGMLSFGQGHTNPAMDPRIAAANFNSQMSGGMPNNMNVNQQRQLMLMQQQMRNSNGNMAAVPNMMNSQQHAYAMAQRGSSQPGNGVGGSPLSAPAGDQFPALRSNSTIPGIARSARSPSDSLHSPMTPRAPSRLSQQPQLQQNDYSHMMMQHPHTTMAQNMATFAPQVQNPNWPQSGQQPMQPQMGMVAGQMNGYNIASPNSTGMGGGFFGSTPSPTNPNWQQHPQAMTGSYPYGQTMGQHTPSDQGRLSHMTSMSIPQNMSPIGDDGSGAAGEFDIFNYNGS